MKFLSCEIATYTQTSGRYTMLLFLSLQSESPYVSHVLIDKIVDHFAIGIFLPTLDGKRLGIDIDCYELRVTLRSGGMLPRILPEYYRAIRLLLDESS